MDEEKMKTIIEEIMQFQMPRYAELPRINLYLEQIIDEVIYVLGPIFGNNEDKWITRTMVGNYVKQGLIPRPDGKKYGKEHIAYLIYISIAKQVLSIGEIKHLVEIQQASYPIELAYDYLCSEFENALHSVFRRETVAPPTFQSADVEANVFRSTVIAVAYSIYTRKMLGIYA